MKTLKLTMKIEKLDGFNEADFINVIKQNLAGLNVQAIRYGVLEEGYRFEIDFTPLLSEFSYQPVLGTFLSIEHEYDKVRLIGIPQDQMEMI